MPQLLKAAGGKIAEALQLSPLIRIPGQRLKPAPQTQPRFWAQKGFDPCMKDHSFASPVASIIKLKPPF